jgi:hypothetical protein
MKATGGGATDGTEIDRNRYYVLLEDELERLAFTAAEACGIAAAVNTLAVDASSYRHLAGEVEDACRLEDLDDRFGFDADQLVEKLAGLTPGAAMAVADAAERFWEQQQGDERSREELLRELGLAA